MHRSIPFNPHLQPRTLPRYSYSRKVGRKREMKEGTIDRWSITCNWRITEFSFETHTVNGGWSSWNSWSTCQKTCGGGTQTRYRYCNHPPPQHNGKTCTGQKVMSQSCNTDPCPLGMSSLAKRYKNIRQHCIMTR